MLMDKQPSVLGLRLILLLPAVAALLRTWAVFGFMKATPSSRPMDCATSTFSTWWKQQQQQRWRHTKVQQQQMSKSAQ
jgi:hypothetical protein